MPLPNVAGVQQAGVDPQSVQKKGDNSQAMMNTLREINARIDNVMNVRGNIQAGVYGAFGNNVLSRSVIGITDAIGDAIGSLFGSDEEAEEDPVTKTLKEHTSILKEIAEKTGTDVGKSEKIVDEIVLLRQDFKHSQELQHQDALEQDKILEQILDALGGTTSRGVTDDPSADDEVFTRIVDELKTIQQDSAVDVDVRDVDDDRKEKEQEIKQTTVLGRIFDALKSINKSIDKLVSSQPMSNREAELEAMRVKREQLEKRTGVEDIKTVEDGGKRGFDWSRLFTGLLDFDANLRGFKNIFGSVIRIMQSGIGSLISAIGPVVSILSKLGSTLATVIASLAGKAVGAAGTLAKAGVSLAKKAMPYAIPAAIMGAAGAAVDYGAGFLGAGGEEIDVAQDEKNWAKMGFFEKTESSLARGVEKVADFIGLDNFSNEARASRIKAESEYLQKKSAGEGLTQIEMTQGDLRKFERLKEAQKSGGSGAAPVIQDNRVTQNQTIMPTRTVVENPEPAYRRYVNNILQPAR